MSIKQYALAVVLALAAGPVMAAECSVVIEANDAMQYNTKEITISKQCKEFSIELKHVGKLPKAAMGHNVVITTTADANAVSADGIAAGADHDYVKAGDARVIAHSALIGGGETSTFKVDTSKLDPKTAYEFFCSFPGHYAIMKGVVKVTE